MRIVTLLCFVAAAGCGSAVPIAGESAALVSRWDSSFPAMPPLTASSSGKFYRYAPSVVQMSANERFAYYCGNTISGQVKDHILYRSAVETGGVWSWLGSEAVAIGPSDSAMPANGRICPSFPADAQPFDCNHVCDPEYVMGTFNYLGHSFALALFYTGTDQANTHNQIGVALADAATGPWFRVPTPVIADPDGTRCAGTGWGVGQPSVTAVSNGRVLLFYTYGACSGATTTWRADVDLSNLDGGVVIHSQLPVTTAGLVDTRGAADPTLNDASFIYDGSRHQFLAVRSGHPPDVSALPCPSFVMPSVQLASIAESAIWDGGGSWQVLGNVAESSFSGTTLGSGFVKNDNAGLLRTPFGDLWDAGHAEVFDTTALSEAQAGDPSCTTSPRADLWTYEVRDFVADQL